MGYGQCDRATNADGKRVKTVFSNDMAIHVWAQRSQTSGQNAKGSIFFEGDSLYSYNRSFRVAQFVEGKGKLCVLLNSNSYSVTTSRHQYLAWRALPSTVPKFEVPGADLDHKAAVSYFAKEAANAEVKGKRSRLQSRKDYYSAHAVHIVEQARAYSEFFGLKFKVPDLSKLVEAAERAHKRELKEAKARELERKAQSLERFKAWQNGDASYCPHEWQVDEHGGTRMRIYNAELQTARGASVPLSHAVKAFRFIKRCRERSTAWTRNGTSVRVGNFTIESIAADGSFVAGCHKFTWAEVERIAKLANVFDLPSSTEARLGPVAVDAA